ncbi:MAG: hypothetical protein M3020_00055 [Myxococcota bacterium]|jgi:hypothetical protein|nr:hypothetical protein [Myxococcota bacterium]
MKLESKNRWAMASLVGLFAAGAGLLLFRGCASRVDPDVGRSSLPIAMDRAARALPEFRDAEQERRYLSASEDGNRRSLELLTRALSAARADPEVDPAYVARLEREHALRSAKLGAIRDARAQLDHQ